jgi:iron complex outermembrane receptor protein
MRSPYVTGAAGAGVGRGAYAGLRAVAAGGGHGLPVSSFGAAGEAGDSSSSDCSRARSARSCAGCGPTSAQVGTVLLDLNTRTPVTTTPQDYAPLGANFSNTFEVGYKGLLGDKVRIATDLWFQRRPADPTTQILNPAVLFNPQQLGAFLGQGIAGGLIQAGQSPAQAQATATAAAGALTPLMAAIPVGATAFTNALNDQPYLVFSYQNASGFVNVHGVDFATDVLLTSTVSLAGTYSWLSDNVFPNAPWRVARESARGQRTEPPRDDDGAIRSRGSHVLGRGARPVRQRVPGQLGRLQLVWIGTGVRYARVPVNAFLDASVSYKLPLREGIRLSLSATNVLDNKVPTFVGVAPLGRLVVSRLQYTF